MNIDIFNALTTQVEQSFDTENSLKKKFLNFIKQYPDNFNSRENPVGHITASVLVINPQKDKVLLTHHLKYNRWLQLGGHWDNSEESCLQTALREMREEGFDNQEVPYNLLNNGLPLDIDIHWIGDHYHYDVCFIAEVDNITPVCSNESHAVDWIEIEQIKNNFQGNDIRLSRMVEKVETLFLKPPVLKMK